MSEETPSAKTCTSCTQVKALSEFPLKKGSKDGRGSQCNACRAAKARRQREALRLPPPEPDHGVIPDEEHVGSQPPPPATRGHLSAVPSVDTAKGARGGSGARQGSRPARGSDSGGLPPWTEKFLRVLAISDNVRDACQLSGIGRSTVYELAGRNAGFRDAMVDARRDAGDILRRELWRRAVSGVQEPVFGREDYFDDRSKRVLTRTVQVGTITRYSDALLKAAMVASFPEEFSAKGELSPDEIRRQIQQLRERNASRRQAMGGGPGA